MTTLFENIDWNLLRQQKETLFQLADTIDKVNVLEDIEGIISLINNIQDSAVDELGYKSSLVFGDILEGF